MAEALAIVGLASNVVQFVDAAGKLASGIHEFYKAGSMTTNSEFETRTTAFKISLEALQDGSDNPMDANLKVLVEACLILSDEMLGLLEELKPDVRKNRAAQAVLKSFKTIRKRQEIRTIEGKLEKLRDMISTHLAVQSSHALTISVKDLSNLTKTSHQENRVRVDALAMELRRLLDQKDWENGGIKEFTKLASQLQLFMKEATENKNSVRILKSLHFKQIKERHSDIPDAHRRTFEWVFDSDSGVNFTAWLTSKGNTDGIYWITGKAGSGKSTLMKFIQDHNKTLDLLRRGASGQEIIVATHYFWSAGTPLQKSQVGLFRTLLFQILSQCPDMIPLITPHRWEDKSFASLESWSRDELLATFKRLATIQPTQKVKICLFVDGLDEYDGDHRELADVFCLLSQSPHLKMCLSSRPWQDFLDAFGRIKWTLRVQDLTKNDIERYVKDNLGQETQFLALRKRDQQGADALAHEIQEKAQGIFLWVYLVVRSLLRGLLNQDSMQDLRRRLNELPTELESYFELMFRTIEPIYRRQNAQVFRLMLASLHTLPVIAFDLVDHAELDSNVRGSFRSIPWSEETISEKIQQQRRQLNASCKDLIHIAIDKRESSFFMFKVGFLHRTVMDFLRTSPMDKMLNERSGNQFDPNASLCAIHWKMFQINLNASTEVVPSFRKHEDLIAGTFYYAREAERQSGRSPVGVLDDMSLKIPDTFWPEIVRDGHCQSFLDVAVRYDLELYVAAKLKHLHDDQIALLLRQSLRTEISASTDDNLGFSMLDDIGLPMLQYILDVGANPNAIIEKPKEVHLRDLTDKALPELINDRHWIFEDENHSRSIWADFLFELQVRAQARSTVDPAWDMTQFLEGRKRKKQLGRASEACELLISYGAHRAYYKKTGYIEPGVEPYILADDAFAEVFADESSHLLSLWKNVEGKHEQTEVKAEAKGRSCIVM